MFPVRYEVGFYNLEDGSLHSHRLRENLKTYIRFIWTSCSEANTRSVAYSIHTDLVLCVTQHP
jgi:hypothetical protein